MKKTRWKNILRGIRGSLNRFLSILFIVALGSGFMAGLAATSPDLYETADAYFDDCAMYDLDIKSTLGFSSEDAEAVVALREAEAVQSAVVADLVLDTKDEKSYVSRVYGLLDENGETLLNRFVLTQGRLPQSADECVVQHASGKYLEGEGLALGDTLTFSQDNADTMQWKDSVYATTLRIVGFVQSPIAVSIISEPSAVGSGKISLDVYTGANYFKTDTATDLFVMLRGAKALDSFSDEYEALCTDGEAAIKAIAPRREEKRTAAVREKAEASLQALQSAKALFERAAGVREQQLSKTAQQLFAATGQSAALAAVNPTLAKTLTQALDCIGQGLQNADAGEQEAVLQTMNAQIKSAQESVDSLQSASWIYRRRIDAAAFDSVKTNVGKVAALSKIFPVFFFAVALLVALTTMTRLVEERRTEMGTLKALGFSSNQILSEYILYALLSSVLGCALGFCVGFRLFPRAIGSAYSMMFVMPAVKTPFRLEIALWVAPVTVCSILLATLFACYAEYRACPARLMQPKAPAAGKRIFLEHITPLWKRLGFTQKVTCRNLFRYRKRFVMTIIGVAGCSALLLTGFGVRDSVSDIVEKQYGEIDLYDLRITLGEDADAALQDEALRTVLDDGASVRSYAVFSEHSGKAEKENVSLCVPRDGGSFASYITLRNRRTKEPIALAGEGAVLTEKLCEQLGVSVGDTVTLENENGVRGTVCVCGITENYVSSYAYLSEEAYRAAFKETPNYKTLYCLLADGADTDSVTASAMASHAAVYAYSVATLRQSFADSIRSINGVVWVLILAAGLLCAVVLYNLINVNICERRRELATLRVLGFHKYETERYIFRETNILSAIGALLGLVLGIWLHAFVVRTVEVDMVMFGRKINPLSFVLAFLITMIFTVLVDQIMRRQIRRIDMVEAMKANE